MARHRSPRGRGANRRSPLSGAIPTAGTGGAHRSTDSTLAARRGLIAAGGAAVLVGQAAFSQFAAADVAAATGSAPAGLEGSTDSAPTQLVAASTTGLGSARGFEPVALAPEPGQADADSLVKAAGLAEAARAVEQETARGQAEAAARIADTPAVRGSKCPPNRSGFGAVKAWVGGSGTALRCIFDVDTVGGVASRRGVSDHPTGLALDFIVDRATGDQLANYALKYKDELKIKYLIWKQRINHGSGWKSMQSRGSVTANHFDHVHVSFDQR